MSITLQLKPRGKKIRNLPQTVEVDPSFSPSDLAQMLSSATGLSMHRLRLTLGTDGSVLTSLKDLPDQSLVQVKDLGPQIGWRTVFLIEYFGPIIIHPLFFVPSLRPYLYPHLPASVSSQPPSGQQAVLLLLILLHFIKRELETLFVHKFSSATMPWRNLPKNSAHYWLLSGLNLAWFLYHPYAQTKFSLYTPDEFITINLIGFWLIAQLSNLKTHLILSNLRPAGTTTRGIPTGYGFKWVTCPNYFFETMGWILVWLIAGMNWSVGLFTLVSAGQMYLWAVKKEKRYRKEFGDKYRRKRAVMIPGLL